MITVGDTSDRSAVDLPTPGSSANRAVKLTALLFGVIAYQLNASMVAPAVPEIARRLNPTPGQVAISQTWFFLVGGVSGLVLAGYGAHRGLRTRLLASPVFR